MFYFVAFQLIAFTRALMLEHDGIPTPTFVAVTIAALIFAKVVLIVGLVPTVNKFPEKLLI